MATQQIYLLQKNKSLDAAKAMWNDKLPPKKTSIILSDCAQH
jgi:hypothetical protein